MLELDEYFIGHSDTPPKPHILYTVVSGTLSAGKTSLIHDYIQAGDHVELPVDDDFDRRHSCVLETTIGNLVVPVIVIDE